MARLVGTGKDPEGRATEGLIFDAPEAPEGAEPGSIGYSGSAQDYIDRGFAKRLDPEDDPGRTRSQIAAAVVRGDNLDHPEDRKIAEGFRGFGENPDEGDDPYAVIHEAESEDLSAKPRRSSSSTQDRSGQFASEAAEQAAADAGLSVDEIEGTGSGGSVTVADVEKASGGSGD